VHPFALQNLINTLKHVRRYYQFLKASSAKIEKSQIAKDVLIDMIECSGLDLEQLEIVLDSSVQSVEALQRTYWHISFFFENK